MRTPVQSLEHTAKRLDHMQRHWHEQHPTTFTGAPPTFTIALMREAGTPGTSVAHAVGARLGWAVYDYELLQRIAEETGLRVNLLESVDERRKGWLSESFEALGAVPGLSENAYTRHLVQTVLSLGALGSCVIVGRGAAFILPAERTLRVRLVGQLDDRIKGAAARLGVSRKEAAAWVERTERERAEFVRAHFLKDSADPHHYDLILNSSRWSELQCADLIIMTLQRLQASVAEPQR
jgi:cytidylate kinase